MEQWKPVVGYEEKYAVSNLGNVMNIQTYKLVRPRKTKRGYMHINLCSKTHQLHRVVAMSWLPNPDNKPHVDHIDGDTTNNRVSNLEWVTPSENSMRRERRSWSTSARKVKCSNGKTYESVNQAAIDTGVSNSGVWYCLNGKFEHVKGFTFKYADT